MKFARKIQALVVAGISSCLFTVGQAQAATYYVDSVTGFITHGDDMDGMRVTATFSGGLTETLVWAGTGSNSGGVTSAEGWSLSLSGDSFYDFWNFSFGQSGLALTKLVLDGIDGKTVFDRYFEKFVFPGWVHHLGTPGSEDGVTYADSGTYAYSNPVALTGADPVGDVWYTLTIDFGNGISDGFRFMQDTDNVISRVPEPASLALFGAGLLGLGFSRRRKS